MGYVDWDSVESKDGKGGGKSDLFIKFPPNTVKTVRPVGRPLEFNKYFKQEFKDGKRIIRTAICGDPRTCPVKQKHTDMNPAKRYAIWAFERVEGGELKLKILEAGSTIMVGFKKYQDIMKKAPGSNDGGDFTIRTVTEGEKKTRDNTSYEVDFLKPTPFTDEEKAIIMAAKENKDYDLESRYASHTPDEVEARLFGEWPPKKNEEAAGTPVASSEPAPAAASGDSAKKTDDFGW